MTGLDMGERSCDIIGLRKSAIFAAIGLADGDLLNPLGCLEFALYVFKTEGEAQRVNGNLCRQFDLTDALANDIVRPASRAIIGSGVPPANNAYPLRVALASEFGFVSDSLDLFEECAAYAQRGAWDEMPAMRSATYDPSEGDGSGTERKRSRFKQELGWVLRTLANPNWIGKDKEGNYTLRGQTWARPHERYADAEELLHSKNPEARKLIRAFRKAEEEAVAARSRRGGA
jgi:hypothetical protein